MQYLPYIQIFLIFLVILFFFYLFQLIKTNNSELRKIKELLQRNVNSKFITVDVKQEENTKGIGSSKQKNKNSDVNIEKKVKTNDFPYLKIETCKNLNSGKFFIVLEEIDDTLTKMVIPNGEIKILESILFGEIEENSLEFLLSNDIIINNQIESYFTYIGNISAIPIVSGNNAPNLQNNNQFEPPYLKTYRLMLSNPYTWPSRMLATIKEENSITQKKLKKIMDYKYDYSPSEANGSFGASLRLLVVDGYVEIEGTGDSKLIIAQPSN